MWHDKIVLDQDWLSIETFPLWIGIGIVGGRDYTDSMSFCGQSEHSDFTPQPRHHKSSPARCDPQYAKSIFIERPIAMGRSDAVINSHNGGR